MKPWLARLHTWVGVVVGLQLVLWLGSGLLMSLLDSETVSGARTRAPAPDVIRTWPQHAMTPRALINRMDAPPLIIERAWRLNRPFWRVQTEQGVWLADAMFGRRWVPNANEILQIAQADYSGSGQAAEPRRWPRAPLEARGHEGAVWQVDFNDEPRTTLYLDATDATVVERRNDTWRLFDIAWMLHIMDYSGRENFNHPLIVSFAAAGLWMALSGLWLLGYALRAGHLRPRWLAARAVVHVSAPGNASLPPLAARSGETVLAAFARAKRPLPSRCGGGQTCGMCVVRVADPATPASDGDRRHLKPEKLQAGYRLACTLTARSGLCVEVAHDEAQCGWRDAIVERIQSFGPSLREIVLRPAQPQPPMRAGSYVIVEIPRYRLSRDTWIHRDMPLPMPLIEHAGDALENPVALQRAYSPSSMPQWTDGRLPLLVRLDVDPSRPEPVGRGSAYLFSLRPGARVRYMGAFGDFQLKPGAHEKIFIGGGAGMAPLRAMILEALLSGRRERIHFWYGARRSGEVPYEAELRALAVEHEHFDFHVVYSEDSNDECGPRWVHDAVHEGLLRSHGALSECEFYLCGPPAMLAATRTLLASIDVASERIAYDDFYA